MCPVSLPFLTFSTPALLLFLSQAGRSEAAGGLAGLCRFLHPCVISAVPCGLLRSQHKGQGDKSPAESVQV